MVFPSFTNKYVSQEHAWKKQSVLRVARMTPRQQAALGVCLHLHTDSSPTAPGLPESRQIPFLPKNDSFSNIFRNIKNDILIEKG